jgi:hypothetical protein
MKAKTVKVYEQKVTVRIRSVPYDMLRYDNCCPASEEESVKLERVGSHGLAATKPEEHVVVFRRFSRNGEGPTVGRWKSFGCDVLSWEAVS